MEDVLMEHLLKLFLESFALGMTYKRTNSNQAYGNEYFLGLSVGQIRQVLSLIQQHLNLRSTIFLIFSRTTNVNPEIVVFDLSKVDLDLSTNNVQLAVNALSPPFAPGSIGGF
eukprot:gene15446-11046_t